MHRTGLAGTLAFATALVLGTTFVFASEPSSTEDCYATGSPLQCFNGSTTVTSTNVTNTAASCAGDPAPAGTDTGACIKFTVGNLADYCNFSQAMGKPPSAGLKTFTFHGPNAALGTGPMFSNGTAANPTPCYDSLGGQDTTTTSGTWKNGGKDVDGSCADSNGDFGCEPNSGDADLIYVPLNGATVTNTLGCTIVVNPDASTGTPFPNTKPFKVSAHYDDKSTLTIKLTNLPVYVTGPPVCPDTTSAGANRTATFAGVYVFTPGVTDKS